MRVKKSKKAKESRVLLVRVGMLGDTIWGTAPIDKILKHYGPTAKVDLLLRKGMGGLFRHDPRVGRVFEVSRKKLPLPFSPTKLRILWHSFLHCYELALDMETRSFCALLFRLLRAKKKILARAIRKEIAAPTEHAVVSVRKIARLALPEELADAVTPRLTVPVEIDHRALFPAEGPYICLHFGNSWLASGRNAVRAWPASRWRQLLSDWKTYFPSHTPVVIGTTSEKRLAQSITDGIHGLDELVDLSGRTDLLQMMAVIAGSDALISTDTGPSHMAAALGIPVVAAFGPTQRLQTGPFADGKNFVEVLFAGIPCSPCVRTPTFRTCERNRCMEAITPEMVATSTQRLIRARAALSGA